VLGIFEPIVRDPDGRVRYHYVVVDYLAYHDGGAVQAGDDAAALEWVAPADLDAYELLPATRQMIERALAVAHPAA
jgi:ADP-ribose pyrophosphatase